MCFDIFDLYCCPDLHNNEGKKLAECTESEEKKKKENENCVVCLEIVITLHLKNLYTR